MSNLSVRQRDSSPGRARLSAVESLVPSAEPDTTDVDQSWAEEAEPRPRHSYIALRPEARVEREARRSVLPTAPHALAHDVWESPHALVILVDVPGVEARHVSLSLGSQALHLDVAVPSSGEARPGVPEGRYEARFEVPVGAGPDSIDAALRHGVLRIRISKENAGTRRVPIISDEQDETAAALLEQLHEH